MTTNSVYKEGQDRRQTLLLPPSLDELVEQDNPVRAMDAYVDTLDVFKLGFSRKTNRIVEGASAFHPQLLLKIYLYGYLNRIRTSRKLAQEIKRNTEMIWLTKGLAPSHTTISKFRSQNPDALKQVFKEFVLLCKGMALIGGKVVAVDGAFLKANASKNKLLMKSSIIKRIAGIDLKIADYLAQLNASDQQNGKSDLKINTTAIIAKTDKLKAKKEQCDQDLAFLEKQGKKQYNQTDPDASLMKKPRHNLVAYNSQIVVDDQHKLIVATDVSSAGNDGAELHKMATQAKEWLKQW